MSHKVVRSIRRPDADTVRLLGDLGVATVHEAQGRTGLLRPYMRPIYPTAKVSGPAITVLCHPGDNLMIHAAIEVCKPGDVLVVAPLSDSTDGMFGELLGRLLPGARRDRIDHRRRRARYYRPYRHAVSCLGQGRFRAGHRESKLPVRSTFPSCALARWWTRAMSSWAMRMASS